VGEKSEMISEKIKEEFEFLYEDEPHEKPMAYEKRIGISRSDGEVSHSKRLENYRLCLRYALFYMPGTFMLLHFGMAITYNLLSMINGDQLISFELIGLFTIISFLMCLFGLGNPKNDKGILIPVAVFGVGSIMGVANFLTNILAGEIWFTPDNGMSLLFLPFALMAGVLTKSWAERNETEKPPSSDSANYFFL